ncbi:hypothetical protein SP19_176 [Salmonella phage 19]|nr:hypothetical protein SP19_176 [Salmonella phage 19]
MHKQSPMVLIDEFYKTKPSLPTMWMTSVSQIVSGQQDRP